MTLDKTSKTRFLHSFSLYPSIKIDSQGENEEVILFLRAHPVTQIFWMINSIVFFMALFIMILFLPSIIGIKETLFIILFGFVFIISYVWFNILSWFFNVGVITNERVVDIDFHSVIYKEISEARLNKIEDVTSKGAGYLGSLFNFGNLFIQTAGTEANIEFVNIPDPSGASHIINEILGKK